MDDAAITPRGSTATPYPPRPLHRNHAGLEPAFFMPGPDLSSTSSPGPLLI